MPAVAVAATAAWAGTAVATTLGATFGFAAGSLAFATVSALTSFTVTAVGAKLLGSDEPSFTQDSQGRLHVVRSAVQGRRIIYGETMVSGVLVGAATTDKTGEAGASPTTLTVSGNYSIGTDALLLGGYDGTSPLELLSGETFTITGDATTYTLTQDAVWDPDLSTLTIHIAPSLAADVLTGTNTTLTYQPPAGNVGKKNEYLHLVIALAGHEVEEIGTVYFNELPSTDDRFSPGGTPYFDIRKYTGTEDQAADSILVNAFPGEWTHEHRLRGIAYLAIRLRWNPDVWPTGIPNIKAVVKGRKLYDPRTGLTAYSNNWALCIRDYLKATFGIAALDDEIDEAAAIAAANISDEDVDLDAGGTITQKRYTIDGAFDLTDSLDPQQVLEGMLTAGAGMSPYQEGQFRILAGAYRTPASDDVIDVDDLRGPLKVQAAQSRRDLFNAVRGTFVYPEKQYQPTDFPPVRNGVYETQDGAITRTVTANASTDVLTLSSAVSPLATGTAVVIESDGTAPGGVTEGTTYYWIALSTTTGKLATSRDNAIAGAAMNITSAGSGTHTARFGEPIWLDIELPFTQDPIRAQRIAKIRLEKSRQAITVEWPGKLTCLRYRVGDVVKVTVPYLGWTEKPFLVTGWGLSPDLGVDLTLQEEAESAYDWNYGNATLVDPAPDTSLASPFIIDAPTNVTLVESSYIDTAGTQHNGLILEWTASNNAYVVEYEVQGKESSESDWQSFTVKEGTRYDFWPVIPGFTYQARVRAVARYKRSEWANASDITVLGYATELPAFTSAQAFFSPDDVGDIHRFKIRMTIDDDPALYPMNLVLFANVERFARVADVLVDEGSRVKIDVSSSVIWSASYGTVKSGSNTTQLVIRDPGDPLPTNINLAGRYWAKFGSSEWRKITSYDEDTLYFTTAFDVSPVVGQTVDLVEVTYSDERPDTWRLVWIESSAGDFEIARASGDIDQIGSDFYINLSDRALEGTTQVDGSGGRIGYFPAPGAGSRQIPMPLVSLTNSAGVLTGEFDVALEVPATYYVTASVVGYRQASGQLVRSPFAWVTYGGPYDASA